MSDTEKQCFKDKLMSHMINHRDDEASSMVSQEEAKKYCDFDLLLHDAAMHDTPKTARRLIELGAKVDCLTPKGETPLMLAVLNRHAATVRVLLEAGASIDELSSTGDDVMQLILNSTDPPTSTPSTCAFEIIETFFQAVKNKIFDMDKFIGKLLFSGYSLFHFSFSNDVKILKCVLKKGIDINSRGPKGMTALYGAIIARNLQLAKWLVLKGADVNAVDGADGTPLVLAAVTQNKAMLHFLLEQGAVCNTDDSLCTAFMGLSTPSMPGTEENSEECYDLLLQHGAVPQSPISLSAIMCRATGSKNLIPHLVMIDRLHHLSYKPFNVAKCYEHYRKILASRVFEELSLLDLLNASMDRMKLLVRKESFISKVEKACTEHKVNNLCSYYYKTVVKRISDVTDMLELENQAIVVISKIFNSNYNECYNFGRKVVKYLSKLELEQLCSVYE